MILDQILWIFSLAQTVIFVSLAVMDLIFCPYIFNKIIGVLDFPLGLIRTFSDKIINLPRKYYLTKEEKYLSMNDIFKKNRI